MNRIAVGLIFLLSALSLSAAPRTAEQAADIAAEFLNATFSSTAIQHAPANKSTMQLVKTTLKTDSTQEPAFYIFNHSNNGFIIISADDRTEDVLCYSDEGSFNESTINPNFAWWLKRYQKQISSVTDETAYTSESKAAARKATQATVISPLLGKIAWGQGRPYNNLCPIDPNDSTRSYTGCVATAAAMVMRKWCQPTTGKGSKTYTCVFYDIDSYSELTDEYTRIKGQKDLTADFENTTYDWANMTETYGKNYTQAQADAVATLMYHCGVASEMMYGGVKAEGSGTYTEYMAEAMVDYFGYEYDYFLTTYSKYEYGSTIVSKDKIKYSVTTTQFQKYFNEDLEKGYPIMIGGGSYEDGGHEFVCDGRDSNGKFHINWGWDGEYNCYCTLSALQPTGTTYTFSDEIEAFVGLCPVKTDTVHVTGLAITPKEVELKIYERETLIADVLPDSATNKNVTWLSSDSSVISLNGSIIRGEKAGQAYVIATSVDGGFSDTCFVTVTKDTLVIPTCDAYEYTFKASCKEGEKQLGDYVWTIDMEDNSYTGYDSSKGAQFGSKKNPVGALTFTTSNTADCAPQQIIVTASIAKDGDAKLEVFVDKEQIGQTITLTTTSTPYTFLNTGKLPGDLTIQFTNTAKAVYVQTIAITATQPSTDTDEIANNTTSKNVHKVFENGQIYILIHGQRYTLLGQPIHE